MHSEILKYTFSGHDSFQCRHLWLKKGYDFVLEGNSFNDEDAVVKLGVGKNMVSAIRYWLKAFNIIDAKDRPTEFGTKLLEEEDGYDPYLEDEASSWLLHYQLVKSGVASIFNIIFNNFRKEKLFFNRRSFVSYLRRLQETNSALTFNENTVAKDFHVFVNTYKNDIENTNVEDSFLFILSELELLKMTGKGKDEQFQIENNERDGLPNSVVLFAILDNPVYGNSIGFNALESEINGPGAIFALSPDALAKKIAEIVKENDEITYTDHAGVKQLQFKNKPKKYEVLDKYYGK